MTTWIIEPRDPLIVRDGRPFGHAPGDRAVSLTFPFPSTTTGGLRTREGLDAQGCFQRSRIADVKQIAVRGPLLVELDSGTGDISQWLAPAPADALLLEANPVDSTKASLKRLIPLELPPRASTNLPGGLTLVGMPKPERSKPIRKAPRFWNWLKFEQWLLDPRDGEVPLADLGHNGAEKQVRTHVSILPETQTNVEGALFQTQGLEFVYTHSTKKLGTAVRLALAVAAEAPNVREGIAPLGGERRLVGWRQSNKSLPACPVTIKANIKKHRHCRVVLLTPAYFASGWRADWLLSPRESVTPTLRAIAVARYQVVSGWDFENDCPKHTRRLAPAGTVLFLELDGDDTAIEKWIDATWMHCVSDDEQTRHDGFGLAVPGTWDGSFQPMEE